MNQEQVKKALNQAVGDYADIRIERKKTRTLVYHGNELKTVSFNELIGGLARVVNDGGMGTYSFTDLDDIPFAIKEASRAAKVVSGTVALPVIMAPVEPVVDDWKHTPEVDFRDISLEEKLRLLTYYNGMVLDTPGVFTTRSTYQDEVEDRTFFSTEGAQIHQEYLFCRCAGRIMVKEGDIVRDVSFSLGCNEDYKNLIDREETIQKRIGKAVDLLKAERAEAGLYTIVTDPDLGGVFIHEAFGHLSEADAIENNHSILEMMKLGKTIGSPILSVVDQGNLPMSPGTTGYDDEGVPTQKTQIIKDGVLVGRIHSRASATSLNEKPTGNCRAVDFRFAPLVRQSNIFIENGETDPGDILSSVEDGLYLCGARGGQTMGDVFTFGAQFGYRIKDGKLGAMVADINILGNVFETLKKVSAVGNDLRISEWGGCGKCIWGPIQMLSKSGLGSPHLKIENVVVGGR